MSGYTSATIQRIPFAMTPLPADLCPHCSQPGITRRAKAKSSAISPATCSSCGGLAYVVTPVFDDILWLLEFPIALVWLALAIFTSHWHPLAYITVLFSVPVALYFVSHFFRLRGRLRATTAPKSRRDRVIAYFILGGLALAIILAGLLHE